MENGTSHEIEPGKSAESFDPEAQPRRHHYSFAHIIMRNVFFNDPDAYFMYMGAADAEETLKAAWDYCGYMAVETNRGQHLHPDGLSVSLHKLNGGECVLITMPEPRSITEALYIAAVRQTDAPMKNRYFVLERGYSRSSEPPRFIFCEWMGETHVTCEDLRSTTISDYFEAIAESLDE